MAAAFPFVALSALNHFYKPVLFAWGPAWLWAADIVQFVVVPAGCWLWLVLSGTVSLAEAGLRFPRNRWRAMVWPTVFGVALLFTVTWPVYLLAWDWGWAYADPNVMRMAMPGSKLAQWGVALFMSISAALVEEVVYRALPWLYLRERLPRPWLGVTYVLGTSLVFAVVHSEGGPAGMAFAFWFGLVMAWHYARQGNLWTLILAHFLVDLNIFAPR